jgi:hypothetical protein
MVSEIVVDTIQSLMLALQTAAKTAQVEMAHAPRDGRVGWAHISEQTTRPVADALRAVPAIAALEPFMYLLPNECSVIDLNSIAIYLTFRAQSVDAEALVHDLLRLVTEGQISVTEVRLVSDIEPADKIDLGDGFSVVPANGVPVTEHSSWIFSERNQPAHGWGGPPTAALTCSRTIPLTLLPRPRAGEMDFPMHDQLAPHTDWDAAMNALIVGSNGAPQFRQHFIVVNDIGWLGIPSTSIGSAESFPVPGKPASHIDAERLAHLFNAFRKQNSTIMLAIKQLESSRRRLSEVERA